MSSYDKERVLILANGMEDAGALPAFLDYAKLGAGYALLLRQFQNRRTLHAYLITGPKGVGKMTFARYLAACQFCGEQPRPCGHCADCRRVLGGNEPDVAELVSRDDKLISIDRIREVITVISEHSLTGGPRVVIIEPVEKLTPAAQNCLLKSLEEPPENVIFLLLAHETSALLGTVASRCALVKLNPWPDLCIREALICRGFDAQQIEAVLPQAGGNLGLAQSLLTDETADRELRSLIDQALAASCDTDVVTLSTRLREDKDNAERALTALEQAIHQALLMKTGVLSTGSAVGAKVTQLAEKATVNDLSDLLQAVSDTRKRRQSQVNWQASIDRLLMKIVEAKTRWQQS